MKSQGNCVCTTIIIISAVIELIYAQRPLSANVSLTATTTNKPTFRGASNGAASPGSNTISSPASPETAIAIIRPDSNHYNNNSIVDNTSILSSGVAIDSPFFPQQYSSTVYQPNRGRKHTFTDLRKNLSAQKKLWDRQGDDPEQNENNKNPMWVLKQKFKYDRGLIMQQEMPQMEDVLGVKCNFEIDCAWTWDERLVDGFQIVTGANLTESNRTGMMPGPAADSRNDANGHFLHLRVTPNTGQRIIRSPAFSVTLENCYLEMWVHQSAMLHGSLRIVIEPQNSHESSWVPAEVAGNDLRQWQIMHFRIGRVSQDFQILFEVVPKGLGGQLRGHVSIDDLSLKGCFPEGARTDTCHMAQVKCLKNKRDMCLKTVKVCDIDIDCDDKEDEQLNCEKIPSGGRCDFESGWCGWQNSGKAIMLWERHSGPTPTEKTGPDTDHTHQYANSSGHYMFVNMNQHANDIEMKKLVGFASNAVMNSVVFNPPPSVHYNSSSPYRNSCMVRFYVHQFGPNAGSINLSVVEIRDKENITTTLWWSSKNRGQDWVRENLIMPNITTKYFLQFEARMGMRIFSDVAIDDFSLSPECFGLNIPFDQLDNYNYWDPRLLTNKHPHRDFINRTVIELTTCGARGNEGPRLEECVAAYNESNINNSIRIIGDLPFKGVQVWKAPRENYYTIIAKGAGGGLGSGGVGSSRGALAVSVLELHKDEEIHMLIGQKGEHACIKSMGYRDKECEQRDIADTATVRMRNSKPRQVKNMVIEDGAGGGGGATYVFVLNPSNVAVPLVVAGGGGGLGIGRYLDDHDQHGRVYNPNGSNVNGQMIGDMNFTGGPGGGWQLHPDNALATHNGASLLEGGRGGEPCYTPRGIHGQGGFGGGGGGCSTGGGGGGYSGGDTMEEVTNGDGGTSYISMTRSVAELSNVYEGDNSGPGSVVIIPAIGTPACGCDYRCVSLDEFSATVACICPENWRLKKDNLTACEPIIKKEIYFLQNYLMIFLGIVSFLLLCALAGLIFILYNRYQRKKQAALRHKMLLEQDLQLSRLRNTADDSALTNFNPNYGCDGILNGNVDVKSLPQVARESLRLLKALGQGAFGEVYQGLYRHRDGDAVEMPVAVKTLPEMSTGQAEADFLMEAAIMAKFNHPNIVHLIGVCFDRHPRFIVLELLAGGDLKNFLREGRNNVERPSALTMKDLVFCSLDVSKGCRYMESKRFIHRDIAARNCLLSSKGPGRVVKIADFGMARDIYRSDYYRKGGKAMLPIKWMPPEAFLDGIFTSKTDVWSFGVLLWEVFSLGLMPYTGLPNRDVMQLVTGGGRLDAPPGCPAAIYRIMADCWSPTPEERPTFQHLLERLSTCTQDPEVMNAPLPSFFRPPSIERDQTIMRPPNNDEFCLQLPNSSDYLIPLPGPRSAAERLLSEATGVTLSEAITTSSKPRITSPLHSLNDSGCWETSFIMPNSKSDQQLLPTEHNLNNAISDDKLISLDTPQQTPITLKPPISFGDADSNGHIGNMIPNTITLDPANLNKKQGMSYANVHMVNAAKLSNDHQNGGSGPGGGDKVIANGTANNMDNNMSTPFTIQGFNERYKPNENHSEISC